MDIRIKSGIGTSIIILSLLCSCKSVIPSAEVKLVNHRGDIVTLITKGYGKNRGQAIVDAEKRAFEVLLIKGIPNSAYRLPMANDKETREVINGFLQDGSYQQFITDTKLINDLKKSKNNKKSTWKNSKELYLEVGINTLALRKHLEDIGGTYKLGYDH